MALAQRDIFLQGPKYPCLNRPATLGDGIVALSDSDRVGFNLEYREAAEQGRVLEFIPASGAATRMFKALISILGRTDRPALSRLQQEAKDLGSEAPDTQEFLEWFHGLENFALRKPLEDALHKQGMDLRDLIKAGAYRPILETLLTKQGLGYAGLPKALIPFHDHPSGPQTALAEHLAEAALLVGNSQGVCRLHFTVSPDHEAMVQTLLNSLIPKYASEGIHFEVHLSQQKRNTDCLSMEEGGTFIRNPDGTLVLRPGGHGALLENLQDTKGDVVFIKNIDNLVPARLREEVLNHRQALGGYLIRLQKQVFTYLHHIQKEPGSALVQEMADFAEQNLGVKLPEIKTVGERSAYLQQVFARPLRVCAMVENQGEPGGGPFWVQNPDGSQSLQIVESAQVNKSNPDQKKIVAAATHFNPVDMVCGLKNHRGELFNLAEYVDGDAYFITTKSKDGKAVKALELPGLWNGSMANWNTAFVEAPGVTFNPVKTVTDLLRHSHTA